MAEQIATPVSPAPPALPEVPKPEDLAARFPEAVILETRKGYSGYVVKPENLIEVATYVRDVLGYDFLSSVTAVDYLAEGKLEVVYHLFRTTGGPAFVYRTQAPREDAHVPSLVPIYRGAELQEREAYDLFGVHFDGHPDLRRILLWEGFYGYPMRKDWKEPYYEDESKPFKSRWPDGHVSRVEDKNPYGKNVQYPPGFDPDTVEPDKDEALYDALRRSVREVNPDMDTEVLMVNMGPQHPSTHGVFRIAVALDGETVVALKPVMGYLHRNHEQIGERNTFLQIMPFTDRLDYLSAMVNNFGYALAVEKLMGVKPPERAEYLRIIMAELTRISNHIFATGMFLNDLGAYFTPSLYAIEERELILDVFEAVSGSRMMPNYFRFGGVARDLPEGIKEKIHKLVYDRLPRRIDELDAYLTNNEIVRSRTEGVGVLTAEQAIAFSEAGPVLRASGVPYDIRRADPYSIYDRFDFDVAVRYHGDTYDRYLLRIDEMRQSLRILQQAIRDIPEGPIQEGKPQYQVRVPAGESYGRVEGTKGELGFYVVSTGKANPYRYHVRAPSFINLTAYETMCVGNKIADVVAILGSIDIVLGELDR
jgi:NADH-quinone oxidoreductase subunit D/NADH-quinone oxidoreductase subunit C/D